MEYILKGNIMDDPSISANPASKLVKKCLSLLRSVPKEKKKTTKKREEEFDELARQAEEAYDKKLEESGKEFSSDELFEGLMEKANLLENANNNNNLQEEKS